MDRPVLVERRELLEPRAAPLRQCAVDILLLGRGVVVDHDGTRLTKPDAGWLELDPRWAEVVAGLGSHPRLGHFAKSIARGRDQGAGSGRASPALVDTPARTMVR